MIPSILIALLLAAGVGVRLALGAAAASPGRYDDAYERARRRPR
jgi:hypothetical protein